MMQARVAAAAWSFRKEIGIICGVTAGIIALPLLVAVGLLTNGVQAASDELVNVNETTHKVEVRNVRGELLTTLEATTAWPIKGTVTQEFGNPNPPYQIAHSGIDIDGGFGSPVTVFMKGKVIKVGNVLAGCGNHCVIVDHGFGITSIYAHMSAHSASVGQEVKPGDVIGKEGQEGWATGPHLHFEIQVTGIPVNPRIFMVGNPPPRGN